MIHDTRATTRPRRLGIVVLATLTALLVLAPPGSAAQSDLAAVRQATAQYHDLDVAISDGYTLGYNGIITGCIANPDQGAMGYHYFNADLIEDPATDPMRPEGLLYAPGPNGQLRLVAVEWVVPSEVWEASGNAGIPSVLGADLHILNPALGWYIHHAWIWKPNPSGMFADWNPTVDCPNGVAPPM